MELNHLNPEKLARALSLTGGGVRGVFTATILAAIERCTGCDTSQQFDVIAGTSVGGIIAIGLACGISGKRIADHIHACVGGVFGDPARLNPLGIRTARHKPDKLRKCVSEILGSKRDLKIRDLDRNIVIPSIDAVSNRIVYFSNVDRIGMTECLNATLLDVALATSAAPTYFPPHQICGRAFLDGGIASNNPDLEALRFCTTRLSRPLKSCKVLSIGSGQNFYGAGPGDNSNPGAFEWMQTHKIIDRIMSLQESKSSELVSELIGEQYMRLDTIFETTIELDDCRQETVDILSLRAESLVRDKWTSDSRRLAAMVR